MKNIKFYLTLSLIGVFFRVNGQKSNTEAKFKVWGNCGMCEKTIEKSLKVKGVELADWDKNTKIIAVKYDSTKITLIQIHEKIAAVGYDTELKKGNDKAYNNLHSCCQYNRKEN